MEHFAAPAAGMKAVPLPSLKLELSTPSQFRNRADVKGNLKNAIKAVTPEDGDTNIFVSVSYNPPAAQHAIENRLLLQSVLSQYLKNGYTEIPNFPDNAISIKPVYKVIPAAVPGGVYKFPGWPDIPTHLQHAAGIRHLRIARSHSLAARRGRWSGGHGRA
jgi:hypothetical protein